MLRALLALLITSAAFADSPAIPISPQPPTVRIVASSSTDAAAAATAPSPVSLERFIWLSIPVPATDDKTAYVGPVTWDIDGENHITIFPVVSGQSYPGFKYDPAEAKSGKPAKAASYKAPDSKSEVLMVYGYSTGLVNVAAWGVKDGKPVKLAVLTLSVGGARPPPKPVDPDVEPDVKPVVKSFRVILGFESGATYPQPVINVMYGNVVEEWLSANCTGGKAGWRRRDQSLGSENDPKMEALWKAVKDSNPTPPFFAVEVNGKVEVIPFEPTPAEMVAKLQTYKAGK